MITLQQANSIIEAIFDKGRELNCLPLAEAFGRDPLPDRWEEKRQFIRELVSDD